MTIRLTTILDENPGAQPNTLASTTTFVGAQSTSTAMVRVPLHAPVFGTSVALSTFIPAGWSGVDEVHVYNVDLVNTLYVTLQTGPATNPNVLALAPATATDVLGCLVARFNGPAATSTPTSPSAWLLASASPTLTCSCVVFIMGH